MTIPSFLLIGCGAMGRRHAAALLDAEVEGALSIAGIYDPSEAGFEALRKEQGERVAHVPYSDDLAALLAKERPEGLLVATTAPYHAPYVRLAADSGHVKLLLLEKPLCVSIAECDEMTALARAHGLRIAVNHQWPFIAAYQKLRALVSGPAFGGVVSASVMGGNIGLAMGGSHALFLFQWMAGTALTEVQAWLRPPHDDNPRGRAFVDFAGEARFAAADGRSLYFGCAPEQHHGLVEVWMCRYGHVVVDRLSSKAWAVCRKEEHRGAPAFRYGMPANATEIALPPMDLIASSKDHLLALIAGEGYVGIEQGAEIVRLLVAAHLSSEAGGLRVTTAETAATADRCFAWC